MDFASGKMACCEMEVVFVTQKWDASVAKVEQLSLEV